MNALTIRDAAPADIAAISAIWNPIIRDTAITFWPAERSDREIADYIAACQQNGHGFFVAEYDGEVQGFAAYRQFRNGGGYAHSMEHTIYAAPAARGLGVGGALLRHVESHARERGARLMIGAITATNTSSEAFHAWHGYREWGRIPAAGFKFGQWHELLLMGKDLTA